MLKATKLVAVVSVMAVAAAGAVLAEWAPAAVRGSDHEIMAPGRGLSLEVGNKHAISYFETRNNACHLTVVIADVTGGETGLDSPGTRIVVPVVPGRGFQLDTAAGRSAEFFCGPGASKMSARVYDRAPYRS